MKSKSFLIYILFFVCFLLEASRAVAQDMDSLKTVLKTSKEDSSRIKIYITLSELCEIEEIPLYAQPAIDLCEKNLPRYKPGQEMHTFYSRYLASGLNNMGFVSEQKGEMKSALSYYEKCLKVFEQIKDKDGMATVLNNIGLLYHNVGDIPNALDYYHRSLRIREELKEKEGIAYSLNNIGGIYKDQGYISKALEYYNRSLNMFEDAKDSYGTANALNNIGYIYQSKGDPECKLSKEECIRSEKIKALDYYGRSLKIFEEIKSYEGTAYSLNNIGLVYETYGDPGCTGTREECLKEGLIKAIGYFEKSLAIQEKIHDMKGIAYSVNNLAGIKLEQGKTQEALQYATRSYKLSRELGYPEIISLTSNLLSKIYTQTGNYKGAYEMQLLYQQMTDSINNENNRKNAIQKGFQYAYDKKAAADSVKVMEERKVFDAQIRQERTQRTALYVGLGLVALFSGFMYNRFRVTKKQKVIIETQKKEVDKQRELADSRRIIAEEQKHVIEEKQKEILDSIYYARRIQQAMLTSEEYITRHFNAEYFIYYQPKDIVSGDFYWATCTEASEANGDGERFYIATADCTGHGVPGAFMSLLNISFLNENLMERNISEPDKILNQQRKSIIKALNPKGNEDSKDGMDCVLCCFDLKNKKLSFSAANNPLWIIRDQQLVEYKADKMPVGKYEEAPKDFTLQEIDLKKGDLIYTFTDGYADQFGGPKGKKFMYKQLEKLLLSVCHLPLNDQKETLRKTINEWKADTEQVDDILVIGVRI